MFDTLFGEGYGLKMVFAFVVVLGLIALTAWLVRRFGSERLGTGTTRGRQPRLAVIDAASVDGRRRLVLIRRDNVEHLMMIGGPTDVVVEANIVRGAQPRDAQAPRPPAATDTLPRAVPLGEGSMWPLQPEPAPAAPRTEPPPRPQRAAAAPPPPPPEEHMPQWQPEPEPPAPSPPPAPRRARPAADPLAGLAEELSRTPAPPVDQTNGDGRVARREPRIARPQPAAAQQPAPPPPAPPPAPAADTQFNSPADQNLADMAHRLEAALRRPAKTEEAPRFAEPQPTAPVTDDMPAPAAARPARGEKPPAAGKSSLYDSLEQEMASLLGRPNKP